eukprot:9307880-Pyramimonas_sp.AAC.1
MAVGSCSGRCGGSGGYNGNCMALGSCGGNCGGRQAAVGIMVRGVSRDCGGSGAAAVSVVVAGTTVAVMRCHGGSRCCAGTVAEAAARAGYL